MIDATQQLSACDVTASSSPAPLTTADALGSAWLTKALAPISGGAQIDDVEIVETIRTTATKIRFKAHWQGGSASLCLKAFLDMDGNAGGGAASLSETDFYLLFARDLGVRVPDCVAAVADRERGQGIIIMRDLIAQGAQFGSALEPLSQNEAADSLSQIARLHAGAGLIHRMPGLSRRIADLVSWTMTAPADLQALLDGPRGRELDDRTRDASRLQAAFRALAEWDAGRTATLLHGDCHAGNIYRTPLGVGLIDWQLLQRGSWALDVAYHICAVLTPEMAEAHEWDLLDHYLSVARSVGCAAPAREEARTQYRAATVYGYYLWAITRRVDPAITVLFVDRLGKAVARHDGFGALGIA